MWEFFWEQCTCARRGWLRGRVFAEKLWGKGGPLCQWWASYTGTDLQPQEAVGVLYKWLWQSVWGGTTRLWQLWEPARHSLHHSTRVWYHPGHSLQRYPKGQHCVQLPCAVCKLGPGTRVQIPCVCGDGEWREALCKPCDCDCVTGYSESSLWPNVHTQLAHRKTSGHHWAGLWCCGQSVSGVWPANSQLRCVPSQHSVGWGSSAWRGLAPLLVSQDLLLWGGAWTHSCG